MTSVALPRTIHRKLTEHVFDFVYASSFGIKYEVGRKIFSPVRSEFERPASVHVTVVVVKCLEKKNSQRGCIAVRKVTYGSFK